MNQVGAGSVRTCQRSRHLPEVQALQFQRQPGANCTLPTAQTPHGDSQLPSGPTLGRLSRIKGDSGKCSLTYSVTSTHHIPGTGRCCGHRGKPGRP